jgi:hypothetical protein
MCQESKKKKHLVQEPKVRLDDEPAQVYLLLPVISIYPLVNSHIAIENDNFQWETHYFNGHVQ